MNEKNESVGTVGQAGQAYVRGIEDQGVLRVVWEMKTIVNVPFTITFQEIPQRQGSQQS